PERKSRRLPPHLLPTRSTFFSRARFTLVGDAQKRAVYRRACDSFLKQTDYAKANCRATRILRRHDSVRACKYVCSYSAGTPACADAGGNNRDIRANCGEGRAECCHGIYHANGRAWPDIISIW